MNTEIEKLSNYTFNSMVNWTILVGSLHFLTLPEIIDDKLYKYIIFALIIYSIFNLLINLNKAQRFKEEHKTKEIKKELFTKIEVSKRSVLDYLNHLPSEHPFIVMSIVGLIMMEQYFDISHHYYQNLSSSTVLSAIYYPSLLLTTLLLIFGDYSNHIVNKYIRRVFKFFVYLYSPIIIGVFLVGLLSPLYIIGYGIMQGLNSINAITDISLMLSLFLQDLSNIFWLALYPITLLFVNKCSYINKFMTSDTNMLKQS